jgi:hypothetical protein
MKEAEIFYTEVGCQCLGPCGLFKPWSSFPRLSASPTGFSFVCLECEAKKNKRYGFSRKGSDKSGVTVLNSTQAA